MAEISVHLSSHRKTLPPAEQLGFGVHFTDHMFQVDFEAKSGWHNPRIIPYGPLQLDPSCCALHYGQSMFEGMKAFRQVDGRVVLFRPDFHLTRMQQGAPRLCMESPPVEIMKSGLKKLLQVDESWVPGGEGCALYIRPTLFASEAFLGVRPAQRLTFFIILTPVSSYYAAKGPALKIWVEKDYVRAVRGGLGSVKASANYVAGLKAAVTAKEHGYHQVLWLNAFDRDHIEEVGTMNVFFRFKDEVVTPQLDGTLLNGCTRDCVIHLLQKWGVKVVERKITWNEVRSRYNQGELLEAFGSGTAAVIAQIGELGSSEETLVLPTKMELTDRLLRTMMDIQYGKIANHEWTEDIYR